MTIKTLMQLDFDTSLAVDAKSYALVGCTCGCQQMKLFLIDENNKAIAFGSFGRRNWISVIMAANDGFARMAAEALADAPPVDNDGDEPHLTH